MAEALPLSKSLQAELSDELSAILEFWMNNMVDREQGGFYGRLDNDNDPDPWSPKGVVLNSRILWAFSAAYTRDNNSGYLQMASRAYHYIVDHFIDHRHGGVYWSVDYKGRMLEGKKQIYGLAFCLYGLSEYYRATGNEIALQLAEDMYQQIERHSYDKNYGGYLEAFSREWGLSDDLRLSEKDDNEKKTTNTHLHILEAYSNLYSVKPSGKLQDGIEQLLDIFDHHLIDPESYHLRLFMNEEWKLKSSLVSYGHDIEAAWLLLESANLTKKEKYISRFKELAIKLADAAAKGLDTDGGLWYEYDPPKDLWIKEKHSWPQAEAMLGFYNAYQLTGEEKYLYYSFHAWDFIKKHIKDPVRGEWFWGVKEDYSVMQKEKAGFWKCPYHNARACLEMLRRVELPNDRA